MGHRVPRFPLDGANRAARQRFGEKRRPARRRRGQQETDLTIAREDLRRLPEFGKMAQGFAATASGEHCNQWTIQGEVVFPEKLLAGQARLHSGGERVADVTDGNAVLAEKALFEGENAEQAIDDAAHRFHSAPAPGPDLGSYEINDRDAEAFHLRGHAEVEIGGIGQDGDLGPAVAGGGDQRPKTPPDARQVGENLDNPDHRQVFGPDHRVGAGGPQMRPRAAEKSAIRPPRPQVFEQFRGVVIPGGFPGGDQNANGIGQNQV